MSTQTPNRQCESGAGMPFYASVKLGIKPRVPRVSKWPQPLPGIVVPGAASQGTTVPITVVRPTQGQGPWRGHSQGWCPI